MKMLSRAFVSNSEMIKNYKSCREKAEEFGKIFILKNNQPDAVLFSIGEYERLSPIIEFLENRSPDEIEKLAVFLSSDPSREMPMLKDVKINLK